MKKATIVTIAIILFTNLSCNKKNEEVNVKNDSSEEISKILEKMYSEDIKGTNPLGDTLLFSQEIIALNTKCDSITKVDIDRISKSNNPTEKPLLREGSQVSSLYEGVTDFKIKETKKVGNNTEVTVTLSNKHIKEQKPWEEKIVFVEKNELKIENIFFNNQMRQSESGKPNLKEALILFLKQNNN